MEPIKIDDLWYRHCPLCSELCGGTKFKSQQNKAIAKNSKCIACARKPENNPMRGRTGELNPFFGRHHSQKSIDKANATRESLGYFWFKTAEYREKQRDLYKVGLALNAWSPQKWIDDYGPEVAEEKMNELRAKHSKNNSGTGNPMYGMPSPAGSGYGWKGRLDGIWFRSLRELRFMLDNPTAKSAEGKFWRAKFVYYGSARTTIPDFVIEEIKTVFECKPIRLHETELVQAKCLALKNHLAELDYEFQLVDPGIVEMKDLTGLIESGRVILSEQTKVVVKRWLSS